MVPSPKKVSNHCQKRQKSCFNNTTWKLQSRGLNCCSGGSGSSVKLPQTKVVTKIVRLDNVEYKAMHVRLTDKAGPDGNSI